MKKVISVILILACVLMATSCLGGTTSSEVSKVANMYDASEPTRIYTTSTQTFDGKTLSSASTLTIGKIDGAYASVYISEWDAFADVETDYESVSPIVRKTLTKEYVEGKGLRINALSGGSWDADGEDFVRSEYAVEINLHGGVTDAVYENHKLTFTVPSENTEAVLGTEIDADVLGEICDEGAVITSIKLTYTIDESYDSENDITIPETVVEVYAEYSYDRQSISLVK